MVPYELNILGNPEKDFFDPLCNIEDKLKELGAEITMREDAGNKNLAYPIGRFTQAHYVYYDILLPFNKARELTAYLESYDVILRFLLIKDTKKAQQMAKTDRFITISTADLKRLLKLARKYDFAVFDGADNTDGESVWHCRVDFYKKYPQDMDNDDPCHVFTFDETEDDYE